MFEFVTGISKRYPALAANVAGEREGCFERGVASHGEDAWVDAGKKDERDEGVGVVGEELPFNRYFYRYEPPRSLEEIDVDLDVLSRESVEMLRGVHA